MPVRKASQKLRLARWWHSKVGIYFLCHEKQVYSLLLSNCSFWVCLHGPYTLRAALIFMAVLCAVSSSPAGDFAFACLLSLSLNTGEKTLIFGTVVTVAFLFLWRLASSHVVCDWWEASGKTSQGLASTGPGCQCRDCLYWGDTV